MRCIFCKTDSASSRSLEHILPESIGNTQHVLPRGVVCDKCNNYFSREVEKPFLESTAIRILRFQQAIPSKRRIIPPMHGVLAPDYPAFVQRYPVGPIEASVMLEPSAVEHLLKSKGGLLLFPSGTELPQGPIVSRFIAKAALEAMAERLVHYPEGLDYLVDESQLDPVRKHARRGERREWPVSVRRIHATNKRWIDETGAESQMVHEYDILKTDWEEWFFVVAIFGLEFAFNFGGTEIAGYERWLQEHDNVSPLYWGKNAASPSFSPSD